MQRFLFIISFLFSSLIWAAPAVNVSPDFFGGTWYVLAGAAELGGNSCYCTSLAFTDGSAPNYRAQFNCRRGSVGGQSLRLPGSVKVLDTTTNARLQLIFPLLGTITANIVAIDAQGRYAVGVDDRGNRTLVLSRTRELAPDLLQQALEVLKQEAPQATVEIVTQSGC